MRQFGFDCTTAFGDCIGDILGYHQRMLAYSSHPPKFRATVLSLPGRHRPPAEKIIGSEALRPPRGQCPKSAVRGTAERFARQKAVGGLLALSGLPFLSRARDRDLVRRFN